MFNVRKGGIVVAVAIAALIVGIREVLPRIRPVEHPTLAQIHYQTETYVGQRVEVQGTVRAFADDSGTYYVLEDSQQNRILLQSTESIISQRVNEPLQAIGTVGFRDGLGIYLDVESVSVPAG